MKKIALFIMLCFGLIYFTSCEQANANQNGVLTSGKGGEVEKTELNAYQVGSAVEDFSLKGVDGKTVSMSNYPDAKGYIVVFTCNTCPYSKMYEGRIKAMHSKYSSAGWPVIAINPNDPDVQPSDSYEEMQKYAKQEGFTFPYALDEGQKVYPKWGATRTPHVFIVSNTSNGKILEYAGAIDDNARDESAVTENYVDKTIQALQAGKSVDPTTVRAIGCSIKTK